MKSKVWFVDSLKISMKALFCLSSVLPKREYKLFKKQNFLCVFLNGS